MPTCEICEKSEGNCYYLSLPLCKACRFIIASFHKIYKRKDFPLICKMMFLIQEKELKQEENNPF